MRQQPNLMMLMVVLLITITLLPIEAFAVESEDTTPPTIVDMIVDQDVGGVTITATDDSSGVKGIYVNDEFMKGDSVFYKIPAGVEMLAVMAEDNAGNKSPVMKLNVAAPDNIKPIIESVFIADNGKTLLVEASDMGSGVKWITVNGQVYEKNPLVLDINGTKNFEITATDNAGNISDTIKKRISEVESSSSSSESGNGGSNSGSGTNTNIKVTIPTPSWTNQSAATLKITLDDSGSYKVEAKSEKGNDWEDISSDMSFILRDNGTIFVRITGDNGAETTVSKYIECFDRVSPEVSAIQQDKTIKIFATDSQSGVSTVYVNGNPYETTNNQSIDFKITSKTKSIMIQSMDVAGNLSKRQTFNIDQSVFKEAVQSSSASSKLEEKSQARVVSSKPEASSQASTSSSISEVNSGDNYYIVIGENTGPADLEKMPIYIFPGLSKEEAQAVMNQNTLHELPPVVDDPEPVVIDPAETESEKPEKQVNKIGSTVFMIIAISAGVAIVLLIKKKKQVNAKQSEEDLYDEDEDEPNDDYDEDKEV